jgi:hypothetical protein
MAKAATTKKKKANVTPKGVAALANIDKPHTKGKYADGKYKVTLKLEKGVDENDAFVAGLREMAKAAAEKQKAAWGKKKLEHFDPVKDGDDSDYEADEGFWLVKFKSKDKPDCRDAKKRPLPKTVKIYGGDVIKVAFGTKAFNEPVQGKGGISLFLNAVQLIEKNAAYGGDAFDEEDGYVADDEVEDEVDDDEEDTGTEDDDAGGDEAEDEPEEKTPAGKRKPKGSGAKGGFDF